jgi:hypothetical protein
MLRQTVRDHINVLQTDLRKHFEHLHIRFGIVEEKRHNPRLAGKSEAEYVAILQSSNLPDPKMMDIAVPADLAYGQPDALPKRHGRPLQPSCKDSQRFDAAVSLLGLVGAGALAPRSTPDSLRQCRCSVRNLQSVQPDATGYWRVESGSCSLISRCGSHHRIRAAKRPRKCSYRRFDPRLAAG